MLLLSAIQKVFLFTFALLLSLNAPPTSEASSSTWRKISSEGSHVVAFAIAQTQSGLLYSATYDGLYVSNNNGSTWVQLPSPSNYPWTITNIVADPTNPRTLYISDNSGLYKSTDAGSSWITLDTGWITLLARAPSNVQTIYTYHPGGINGRLTYPPEAKRTTDEGHSWKDVTPPSDGVVNALFVDPVNPQIVYAGTSNGVRISTDGGDSWNSYNTGLTTTYILTLVSEPGNAMILYATDNNTVFKSIDRGKHWAALSVLPSAALTMVIDPAHPSIIYAGIVHQGVYQSVDGGVSWHALGDGLNKQVVSSIQLRGQMLYALASEEVFFLPGENKILLPIVRR